MRSYSILVVDDEDAQRETLAGFLKKRGYAVYSAASGKEALDRIRDRTIDLILTDLRMPGMDGEQLLTETRALNPDIDVVLMTAYGSIEAATAAMKEGAADFITKPIELEQLERVVEKLRQHKQLVSENRRLRELVDERLSFGGIITASSAMQQALSVASRVADSTASVLILGESGTGKELIARALHFASHRAEGPFVAVNMAALPDNLVEAELFGHEKGAFTGADRQRKGRFERADGGTLFIDEVGEVPLNTQVKLLRVLQEQQIERVGSGEPVSVDVRVIAATHQDLDVRVREGHFREDFYYRLNVVSIHLPPLRRRRSDIPLLADHFVRRYREQYGKAIEGISREAMDLLMKYDYPGNVRELENVIERAVVLSRDETLTTDDLPAPLRGQSVRDECMDSGEGSFQDRVERFERQLLADALQQTGGIQTRAAERLGMTERHLRYKLKKYGMKPGGTV